MQISKTVDYYLLRSPLLPIEDAFNFINGGDLQQKQYLSSKIANPIINSSFFLASPDFNNALKKYLNNNKICSTDEKIVKSFYKYFIRMSSRCTPFGLFAGCALGEFLEKTTINFDSDKLRSISRLDMYYVSALSEYLNKIPAIREQLTFFPNETIYTNGDKYRYIEFTTINSTRSYKLSSFSQNSLVSELLRKSQKGLSFLDLKRLVFDKHFKEEEVELYIQKLIDAQILVSDLLPSVTGDEYLLVLIEKLKTMKDTVLIVSDLQAVNKIIKSGDWTETKEALVKKILSCYIPTTNKNIVQTDLFFNTTQNSISRSAINEISDLVEEWISIYNADSPFAMTHFIRSFEMKYGNKQVPLLKALDNDNGIGYGGHKSSNTCYMPLLDSINFSKGSGGKNVSWDKSKSKKLTILNDAIHNGLDKVDLRTCGMFGQPKHQTNNKLPGSMYMFGSLFAKSSDQLDEGNFQFLLSSIGGPSSANLLGRFCHGDQNLAAKVKKSLIQEENSHDECLYAEIVHLPDGRTGNVIMRPALRKYEIPILTKPAVDTRHTIQLSDLLVSIEGGEIVLHSKKLGKRVIPRLTSAHNYNLGLPVYKFLGDLQHQGFNNPNIWDWSVLKDQPFLPRIQYGKLILERATWNLSKEEYAKRNEQESISTYFEKLQDRYKIPDKVAVIEGDNELLLSLSSEISIKILCDKLKKRNVKIKEYLFSPDNCFIKDKKGSYANELIVPFSTQQHSSVMKAKTKAVSTHNQYAVNRSFHAGDSWIYFKIYTGNKSADKILTEIIKPLAEDLLVTGTIEKWFFLRYDEHGYHIRLRFFNAKKPDFWAEVVRRVNKAFELCLKTGLVDKIQIDTYEREIERYGNATMELSEQLFFYDSIAITEFLELIDGDQGEEYRWLLALLNIDFLLNDFKLSLYEKFQLLSQLREYFYEETNKGSQDKNLWISLNNKYRKFSKDISNILDHHVCEREDVSEAVSCFVRRSERVKLITEEIRTKIPMNSDDTEGSLFSFLSSHIHMTLNRTFLAKQRIHETVIYHFLTKYYDSKISRMNNKEKKVKKSKLQMEKS